MRVCAAFVTLRSRTWSDYLPNAIRAKEVGNYLKEPSVALMNCCRLFLLKWLEACCGCSSQQLHCRTTSPLRPYHFVCWANYSAGITVFLNCETFHFSTVRKIKALACVKWNRRWCRITKTEAIFLNNCYDQRYSMSHGGFLKKLILCFVTLFKWYYTNCRVVFVVGWCRQFHQCLASFNLKVLSSDCFINDSHLTDARKVQSSGKLNQNVHLSAQILKLRSAQERHQLSHLLHSNQQDVKSAFGRREGHQFLIKFY